MKELSIEEKAQAYEKVREKIAIRFGSNVADEIFSQFEMSEDERIRKEIMGFIFDYPQKLTNRDSWLDWLEKNPSLLTKEKALKNSPFVEQKPADKVEPKFKVGQTIKKECFNLGFTIVKIKGNFYYNDVGDNFPFTDQDNWELVEQKPAWSEEDERCLTNAIDACKQMSDEDYDYSQSYIDAINWLKSLKDRYTWKPSDEQIEVLENVRKILHTNDIYSKANNLMCNFEELIRTLKKLREK